MNRTLADALREEEVALHQRFVHATRPREPMSLEDARDLAERMAWCVFCKKTHPDGATCMGHHP